VSDAVEGEAGDDGPMPTEASGVMSGPNSTIAVASTSPIVRMAQNTTGIRSESPANDSDG